MQNDTISDEVYAVGVDESYSRIEGSDWYFIDKHSNRQLLTTGEQMKVEFDRLLCSSAVVGRHIHDDNMAGIVTSSEACADVDVGSEDINELVDCERLSKCQKSAGVSICRCLAKVKEVRSLAGEFTFPLPSSPPATLQHFQHEETELRV